MGLKEAYKNGLKDWKTILIGGILGWLVFSFKSGASEGVGILSTIGNFVFSVVSFIFFLPATVGMRFGGLAVAVLVGVLIMPLILYIRDVWQRFDPL